MNCPESHLECDDLCEYRRDDKCHSPYWSSPVSIFDLMTHGELVVYLLKHNRPQPEWTGKQWDAVQQGKALTLHLQDKLNEHIDKGKKAKRSKYD